mmetsp:Transcript_88494/g.205899  ORF Transcript_88494/g.205899 Transcript_88494/m.205899 type:complete len:205 (+) Transcript_88494:165-779(+)
MATLTSCPHELVVEQCLDCWALRVISDEATVHNVDKRLGVTWLQGCSWRAAHGDQLHYVSVGGPAELLPGHLAGGEFNSHDAKGPHVSLVGDARHLAQELRRHEVGRAGNPFSPSEILLVCADAKIAEVAAPTLGHKRVLTFDVAVDNSTLVEPAQGSGHVNQDGASDGLRHAALLLQAPSVDAVNEFHRNEQQLPRLAEDAGL